MCCSRCFTLGGGCRVLPGHAWGAGRDAGGRDGARIGEGRVAPEGHGLGRSANWSTGKMPGENDIACFLAPSGRVAVQPELKGNASVGGLYFDNGASPRRRPDQFIPGAKPVPMQRIATWSIRGRGRISLGKGGVEFGPKGGTALIYPDLELRDDQPWRLGDPLLPGPDRRDGLNLKVDEYGNDAFLVIQGVISGKGGIRKTGMGRVVYANAASPTFQGGTRIEAGVVQWRIPKIAVSGDFAFGASADRADGRLLLLRRGRVPEAGRPGSRPHHADRSALAQRNPGIRPGAVGQQVEGHSAQPIDGTDPAWRRPDGGVQCRGGRGQRFPPGRPHPARPVGAGQSRARERQFRHRFLERAPHDSEGRSAMAPAGPAIP